MKRPARAAKGKAAAKNPFQLRPSRETNRNREPLEHVYGHDVICVTDKRGHATPRARSPLELVVDSTNGFVPLWEKDTVLRWRFQDRSMTEFRDSEAAKSEIRTLL